MIPARIEVATVEHADDILALIKRAFAAVGEQYGDRSLPPLVETCESFKSRFADEIVLKATLHERLVGAVIGALDGDVCRVGRLVVEPDFQGRGIGRALATEIERHFPEATRFELFTGDRSVETLGLYESLGYRESRRVREGDRLSLVYLEKNRI